MLLRHLPLDSATARAVVGPAGDWSTEAHLLAALIDVGQQSNYQFALAHTPKGKQQPRRPRSFPRPGVESEAGGDRHFGSKRGTFTTPQQFDAAYQRALANATEFEEVIVDVS